MNADSYASWKNVYSDFLEQNTSKENYCRGKGLELNWFNRQCRKAETYEKRLVPKEEKENKASENLKDIFVELIPEKVKTEHPQPGLKLNFRGVSFELPADFEDATLKRALQVVQEAL